MNVKKIAQNILGIGAAVAGVALLKLLSSEANEKYSGNWLESASNEELEAEREKVRLDHCSGDEKAWNILAIFDNEMRRRSNEGHENEDYQYPKHREHGWYLSNDD